nr:K151 [uncultured bacterium]
MKIVVTGGSGQFGRQVIRDLAAHGHGVLSLDRTAHPDGFRPSWVVDVTQPGDLYQAMRGADALVHLAAIPAPRLAPDTTTFNNNVAAAYNALKAAADTGVKRVVVASSIAAYGYIYAPSLIAPDYLPLDEAHPCRPVDPYGLSKVVGETIAESFARGGMTIVSLRFPGIYFDPKFQLLAERMKDPRGRAPGCWTYIDARDAAAACRLALTADLTGHTVFNVAAPNSNMRQPTDELIRQFFPHVKTKPGLTGNWSGMDSTKAQRGLGFRAQHTWDKVLPA